MSSNTQTTAAGGQFGTVGTEPQRVTANEVDVDLRDLSSEEQEVVGSENFILYGKANIEQWNEPGAGEGDLYIEMDAFEGNIDQLLAIENISIGHNDVRIGEPLASHTLEDDSTVHINANESLQFSKGDELKTGVYREGEELPNGEIAQEDALWLVANLFGKDDPRGSRFSQKARLGAYYGELDGFSVTVDKKDMTVSDDGTVVHDLDFLAVTVGSDDMIKNPGSSFGVAEFQAIFGGDTAADDPANTGEDAVRPGSLEQLLSMSGILQRLLGSSRDALASEAIQQAHENDGIDLQTAVDEIAGDGNQDAVMQAVDEIQSDLEDGVTDIVEQADDAEKRENMASDLADELGVDKEVVMAAIDEIEDMSDDMEEDAEEEGPPEQEGDCEDDDDDTTETEMNASEIADAVGVEPEVVEDILELADSGMEEEALEQALDGLDNGVSEDRVEQLEARVDEINTTVEEQLDGLGEQITETIESQMETGSTPGPSGGGIDAQDLEESASDWASSFSGGDD